MACSDRAGGRARHAVRKSVGQYLTVVEGACAALFAVHLFFGNGSDGACFHAFFAFFAAVVAEYFARLAHVRVRQDALEPQPGAMLL